MRKWVITAAAAALLFAAQPSEAKAQVVVTGGYPTYDYGYYPYSYAYPYYGGTGLTIGTGNFSLSFGAYPSYGYYGGYRPYYGSWYGNSWYGYRGYYGWGGHHGRGYGGHHHR